MSPLLSKRHPCLCNYSGHTIHVTTWFFHRVSQTPVTPGYLSQPAQMPRLSHSETPVGVVLKTIFLKSINEAERGFIDYRAFSLSAFSHQTVKIHVVASRTQWWWPC